MRTDFAFGGFFAESGGVLPKECNSCRQNPKTRLTQKIQDQSRQAQNKRKVKYLSVILLSVTMRTDLDLPTQQAKTHLLKLRKPDSKNRLSNLQTRFLQPLHRISNYRCHICISLFSPFVL